MPSKVSAAPVTTADLDAQIRDIEAEVRQLESRKKELEQHGAVNWANPDPAAQEEFASVLYRLGIAPHRIAMLQEQRKGIEIGERQAALEDLHEQFKVEADRLHAVQQELLYQKQRETIRHNSFQHALFTVRNAALKIASDIQVHNNRLAVLKVMSSDDVERSRGRMNRALALDHQFNSEETNARRREAKAEYEAMFREKFDLDIDLEVPPV